MGNLSVVIVVLTAVGLILKWGLTPRAPQLAKGALRAVKRGAPDPYRGIAKAPTPVQVEACVELARLLAFEELYDQAWEALERGAALDPGACTERAAALATRGSRPECAIRICRAALEREPRVAVHRLCLGDVLLNVERDEEALELYEERPPHPLLAMGRAEALVARGRGAEALELLDWARKLLDMRLGGLGDLGGNRDEQEANRRWELLSRELRGGLRGAESDVEDALRAGTLDPQAPVNLTLIGRALMVQGGCVAVRLELGPPEQDLADAQRRLKDAPTASRPCVCWGAPCYGRGGWARPGSLSNSFGTWRRSIGPPALASERSCASAGSGSGQPFTIYSRGPYLPGSRPWCPTGQRCRRKSARWC